MPNDNDWLLKEMSGFFNWMLDGIGKKDWQVLNVAMMALTVGKKLPMPPPKSSLTQDVKKFEGLRAECPGGFEQMVQLCEQLWPVLVKTFLLDDPNMLTDSIGKSAIDSGEITAVDMDYYLSQVTPEMHEMTYKAIPAEYRERAQTAQAESVALVEAYESAKAGKVKKAEYVHAAEWIRLSIYDTELKWRHGTGKTCLHAPGQRDGELAYACAWKPNLVVCNRCTDLLKPKRGTENICDGCGHVCGGIDNGNDDPIHTVTVWYNTLAYQIGVCRDCLKTVQIPETAQE